MRRLAGFAKAVRAVAFLPDGRLVAAGEDKWVRVFDPTSAECAAAVKSRQVVYAVAAAPDGKEVAFAGRYGTLNAGSNAIYTLDPDDGVAGREFVWPTSNESRSVWSLSYSADGHYLAAAARTNYGDIRGGEAHSWRRHKPFGDLDLTNPTAATVRFSPHSPRLATGVRDDAGGAVLLHHHGMTTGAVNIPLRSAVVAAIAFAPVSESFIVAAGSYLYFVSPESCYSKTRLKTSERTLTALAASPDGRALLAAGRSGVVECYDAHSRTLRSRHDFGVGPVHALAFAPDGLTFAVAGDGGVVVCDAE